MRSDTFIRDNAFQTRDKAKQVASILIERDGTVYSYGYHYPLLFIVNGLKFRNTAGYSATTGKHISWCGGLSDYNVELDGVQYGTSKERMQYDNVLESLNKTLDRQVQEEKETKRKGTQKNTWQIIDIRETAETINALELTV